MKILNIQNNMSFGRIRYNTDEKTQNSLKKLRSWNNCDVFQRMDEIDQLSKSRDVVCTIEPADDTFVYTFSTKGLEKPQEEKRVKTLKTLDPDETVRNRMQLFMSLPAIEFQDDEVTQTALRKACGIGSEKSLKDDYNQYKKYSDKITQAGTDDVIVVYYDENAGCFIDRDRSEIIGRAETKLSDMKRTRRKEAITANTNEFYNFSNINMADDEVTRESLNWFKEFPKGETLLFEKFDWLNNLAAFSNISLNVRVREFVRGNDNHRFLGFNIKDAETGLFQINLFDPHDGFGKYQNENSLNKMFDECSITQIPQLKAAREDQLKNHW